MNRIIAIDGPSGAGKSTLAKNLSRKLNFLHVDSGALYRIVTFLCLHNQIDTADPQAVANFATTITLDFEARNGAIVFLLNGTPPGDEIRSPLVNQHASPVATVKEVRERITSWLRALTRFGDLVVEGRDITTAVFPDAPVKFYLVATAEARAERRHQEEIAKGIAHQSVSAVKNSLLNRDSIDSTRQYAPLRKANGAYEIDSTHRQPSETLQVALDHLPPEWIKTCTPPT